MGSEMCIRDSSDDIPDVVYFIFEVFLVVEVVTVLSFEVSFQLLYFDEVDFYSFLLFL